MKDLRHRPDHTRIFGDPVGAERGDTEGVTFLRPEDRAMSKAKANGIYTLNGHRFFVAAGDQLPDGAVMDADLAPVTGGEDEPEERAKGKAPQNRAKGKAPENREA